MLYREEKWRIHFEYCHRDVFVRRAEYVAPETNSILINAERKEKKEKELNHMHAVYELKKFSSSIGLRWS